MSNVAYLKNRAGKFTELGEASSVEQERAVDNAVHAILSRKEGRGRKVRVALVEATAFNASRNGQEIKPPAVGFEYPSSRAAALALGCHVNTVSTAFCNSRSRGEKPVRAKVHGITLVYSN